MPALILVAALTAAGATAAKAGPPFPRIANCYGVGLTPWSTDKDIAEVARFDLLIGGLWCNWADAQQKALLAGKVEAIRRINPAIIILDFSSSAPYADPKDPTFPADGWLLQPDGARIEGWPGTQMVNLTRPAVLDWLVARSVASVRDRAFDGTFIDCMGSGFDWWACNIESGKAFGVDADGDGKADDRAALDRAWVAAKTELSRRVRAALGPGPVFMTNQAGFWGLPDMNGILLEDDLDYVLAGNLAWDDVMRDYLRWTASPRHPNVTTIVSSSGLEPPYDPWRSMTEDDRKALLDRGYALKQRMRFGLATTLMGDGYYAYDLHTRWRGQRWWYPEYDAPLGHARGPARRVEGGAWRRDFDGGTAVVNPTVFDVPVAFGARRRDASTDRVAESFIVPAQDGRILLKTDEPPRPGAEPDAGPAFTVAGPEPVVERGDRILLRAGGMAALLDGQGQVLRLGDADRSLVEGVRPFIVSNDRWRDFAYAACAHRAAAAGRVVFTGRRTEGDVALDYRETVRLRPGECVATYQWTALSDGHAHMWRHQLDFPMAAYGGGSFVAGAAHGALPAHRAPTPSLAGPTRKLALTPERGPTVTVVASGDLGLVDERHYGIQAFRVGLYPASGDFKAGQGWAVTLSLRW